MQNKLQKAQKKSDKIAAIIHRREYGIKLEMVDEDQQVDPFIDMMEYINSHYYKEYNDRRPHDIIDPVFYIQINTSYEKDKYYVIFNTNDVDNLDKTAYEMNILQLKEFLLMIYYDQLILIL